METTTIERFGELIKEEPLRSLDEDMLMPDTMALDAVSPFFGYYNDAPMAEIKPYVYLVLDHCPGLHAVTRAASAVKKQTAYCFTADPGMVHFQKSLFHVIRIRDIDNYIRLKSIQEGFANQGIIFKKPGRQKVDGMCIIMLQKFLNLNPLGNGLYLDAENQCKGYFSIPVFFEWERFKMLALNAKYDTSILFFDAAQALFYENRNIIDLVRVYKEHLTVEKLTAIRDRFLKVLDQDLMNSIATEDS